MGVAKADPAELTRYRAKQTQTHNLYIQKRQAVTKRGVSRRHDAQARGANVD